MQTKLLHIILHTFIPSLPPSTRTSHPRHHNISTGRHPIIPTLMFHMPKPPQSTLPHHLSHALYTQKTIQIHTAFPILQRQSAHPSHHHPFRPLQTMEDDMKVLGLHPEWAVFRDMLRGFISGRKSNPSWAWKKWRWCENTGVKVIHVEGQCNQTLDTTGVFFIPIFYVLQKSWSYKSYVHWNNKTNLFQ